MKVILGQFPGGQIISIVCHDLFTESGRRRKVQPIHALTFLAQHLVPEREKVVAFKSGLGLENKLSAVERHLNLLKRAFEEIRESGFSRKAVQGYSRAQNVIAHLEAFLGAVYTSLEIAARINKSIHPDLPDAFRKQSERVAAFQASHWAWLGGFYDLRSELVHWGTLLPVVSQNKLLVEFTGRRGFMKYSKGRHAIPFDEVCAYRTGLLDLLNEWAFGEVAALDDDHEIQIAKRTGLKQPLAIQKCKAKDILALVEVRQPSGIFFRVRRPPL